MAAQGGMEGVSIDRSRIWRSGSSARGSGTRAVYPRMREPLGRNYSRTGSKGENHYMEWKPATIAEVKKVVQEIWLGVALNRW